MTFFRGLNLTAATIHDYRFSEGQLNETGFSLGQLAAMLSDIADCLSHDPVRLTENATQAEWPSFDKLQALVTTWLERRDVLVKVWEALSDEDRLVVGSAPDFGAPDPSLPCV